MDDLYRIENLIDGQIIDLLFTVEWPEGICQNSEIASPAFCSFGSEMMQKFTSKMQCQYIFAIGENTFFEREPFINHNSKVCTRFTSLGNVGGPQKVLFIQTRLTKNSGPTPSTLHH